MNTRERSPCSRTRGGRAAVAHPEHNDRRTREIGAAVASRTRPGDRGTEIHVDLRSRDRAAASSASRCEPRAAPLAKVKDELRRFKQLRRDRRDPALGRLAGGRARPSASSSSAPRSRCERRRAREGGCAMRANVWSGRNTVQVENVPDPKILNDRDAIVTHHLDGDLRLGPAPLQRLHPDDGEGRHPRPRVHGRGRRGRPRRQEPQGRRPRGRPVPDRLRQLLVVPAASCTRSARTPTRTRGWPRSCSATRPAGIFGYSHLIGGFAGGQAEYARVPFADVGPLKIAGRPDRRAGAVPLGHLPDRLHGRRDVRHQAAATSIAVWGCGPGRPVRDRERAACSAPSG